MEVKINAEPIEEGAEKEKKYGKYDEWKVESAARTLSEAEEIKADPELMKYVKMCMEEKYSGMKKAMESISSIDDLKKIAKSRSKD